MKLLTKYGPDIFSDWSRIRDEIVPVEITPAAQWWLSHNTEKSTDDQVALQDKFPCLSPPWESCVFEYSPPPEPRFEPNRILVDHVADEVPVTSEDILGHLHGQGDRRTLREWSLNKSIRWVSYYASYVEWRDGAGLHPISRIINAVDDTGKIQDSLRYKTPGHSWGLAESLLLPVYFGISLLHCKNTELVDDPVPPKVRENRKSKGKEPGVTFKQLKINPMQQQTRREAAESGESEMERALHICRGHFKDYRDGEGLFGKYKGVYWWDMHVRGSEDEGRIEKEYEVNAP